MHISVQEFNPSLFSRIRTPHHPCPTYVWLSPEFMTHKAGETSNTKGQATPPVTLRLWWSIRMSLFHSIHSPSLLWHVHSGEVIRSQWTQTQQCPLIWGINTDPSSFCLTLSSTVNSLLGSLMSIPATLLLWGPPSHQTFFCISESQGPFSSYGNKWLHIDRGEASFSLPHL